ncbi:hypothetical protein [Accumulibacter sp.]|uniref:hypothetical protein n=1 Tax=Accumulibacter sp. TaxID=2053492 RepID=UPI002628889A|nr:hypothetical protein [Accumulibacter sp.]
MKANDTPGLACSGVPVIDRCAASLPDNPQCAPNYHFGMLLGVADLRAEQGFHVGRLRRHQRLLHGSGVVAGYPVRFDTDDFELHVGPGYAIDALGRDLLLDVEQCVSLPKWWEKHAGDEEFDDIEAVKDARFDLDVIVGYGTCLAQPVPAIAEPCAGSAADIAYARLCERPQLALVRHVEAPAAASPTPYHLLQRYFGRLPMATDSAGQPLPAEQWLTDRLAVLPTLPAADQAAARAALLREVSARAVAEMSPLVADELMDAADDDELRLPIARLRDVHVWQDASGWQATIGSVELGGRDSLLPGYLLQALLLTEPPPAAAAGAVVVGGGATLAGSDLTLVFSQRLAVASVQAVAFGVSEYLDDEGWKTFVLAAPTYDESDPAQPSVTLTLDRAPVGSRLRVSVVGTGSTPLLGANLIPAGALLPDSDGRTLTTTIFRG